MDKVCLSLCSYIPKLELCIISFSITNDECQNFDMYKNYTWKINPI